MAQTSASTASEATTVSRSEIAVGRGAGRRVDQVVQLAPVPAPAPAVAARRGERAGDELEREAPSAVSTPTGQRSAARRPRRRRR